MFPLLTRTEFIEAVSANSPTQSSWYSGYANNVKPQDFEDYCNEILWALDFCKKVFKDKYNYDPSLRFVSVEVSDKPHNFGVRFMASEEDIVVLIDQDMPKTREWHAYSKKELIEQYDLVDRRTKQTSNFRNFTKMNILGELIRDLTNNEIIPPEAGLIAFEQARYEVLQILSVDSLPEFRQQTRNGNLNLPKWRKEFADVLNPRESSEFFYDLYWGIQYAINHAGGIFEKDKVRVTLATECMVENAHIEGPFLVNHHPESVEVVINPFYEISFSRPYSSPEPLVLTMQAENGLTSFQTSVRGRVKIETAIEIAQQLYSKGLMTLQEGDNMQTFLVEQANLATKYGRAPYAN